jgi:hypothetical protein
VSAAELADLVGSEHVAIAASGYEVPVAGSDADHEDFRNGDNLPFCGPTVRFLHIPHTGWGDYVGGTCERSNYRTLLNLYPDYLITVGNDQTGHSLLVRLDSMIPSGLYESIDYLGGECLLSDDDLCDLEREVECECWDSAGRNWFVENIRDLAWDETDDLDEPDTVDELDDYNYADELADAIRSGPHRELLEFTPQDATDGSWKDLEEAAMHAWNAIKEQRAKTAR